MGFMKKKEIYERPKDLYVDGEKLKFLYDREERLKKSRNRIKDTNCFLCRKNIPYFITFLNIILVCLLGLLFSKFVGRADVLNNNGIQYFISRKYFSNDVEFNFQIKNVSKEKRTISYTKKIFEVLDDKDHQIFLKEIIVSKDEYRPNEFYLETIIIDKPKFGNYKAVLYIDVNRLEKVELKFNIR